MIAGSQVDDGMARPLVARGTGYRMDLESETFVVASPVRASDGHHGWSGGRGDGADNLVVADPISTREQKTWTHEGKNKHGVRRLTPLECERLQGFPDGWTALQVNGKLIPDSHRYRMLGNAVATVVSQYIGHRLVAVDQLLRQASTCDR